MDSCLSLSILFLREKPLWKYFLFSTVVNTPGHSIYIWPLERNMYWYPIWVCIECPKTNRKFKHCVFTVGLEHSQLENKKYNRHKKIFGGHRIGFPLAVHLQYFNPISLFLKSLICCEISHNEVMLADIHFSLKIWLLSAITCIISIL